MRVFQASLYPWFVAAGLCLAASSCSYRQGYIDSQEEQQLTNERAKVDSTEQDYRTSVNESGMRSQRSLQAKTDADDAQSKLTINQRQYDNYLSASGQSSEPRE